MPQKPYSPVASYSDLKQVETLLKTAATADDVRALVVKHGTKIGYKAFCYMFTGKMSAAAMKPDEACVEATRLESAGQSAEALAIYKEVAAVHPEHPLAGPKAKTASAEKHTP